QAECLAEFAFAVTSEPQSRARDVSALGYAKDSYLFAPRRLRRANGGAALGDGAVASGERVHAASPWLRAASRSQPSERTSPRRKSLLGRVALSEPRRRPRGELLPCPLPYEQLRDEGPGDPPRHRQDSASGRLIRGGFRQRQRRYRRSGNAAGSRRSL